MAKRSGNIREQVPVSFKDLQTIAGQRGAIRVGATEHPQDRASQYQSEGYSGVMYHFKTENMRKAENRLLQQTGTQHNVQQRSNAEDRPGYVYAIQGRKYKQ